MDVNESSSPLRHVLLDLPRKKVALVVVLVLVNAGVVIGLRGHSIATQRGAVSLVMTSDGCIPEPIMFLPPWEWTADEWVKTVWPWS